MVHRKLLFGSRTIDIYDHGTHLFVLGTEITVARNNLFLCPKIKGGKERRYSLTGAILAAIDRSFFRAENARDRAVRRKANRRKSK